MTKNIFKLLFAATLLFTVLVFDARAQAHDLASKQWKLTSLNGSAVPESKALIEIDPAAGRFNGNAGCNRMFGSVKVSGKDVTFSGIGTTKMMCVDQGVAKLESEFVAALGKVTRYKVSGNVLTMYAGGHRTVQYKALASRSTDLVLPQSWKTRSGYWNGSRQNPQVPLALRHSSPSFLIGEVPAETRAAMRTAVIMS